MELLEDAVPDLRTTLIERIAALVGIGDGLYVAIAVIRVDGGIVPTILVDRFDRCQESF